MPNPIRHRLLRGNLNICPVCLTKNNIMYDLDHPNESQNVKCTNCDYKSSQAKWGFYLVVLTIFEERGLL